MLLNLFLIIIMRRSQCKLGSDIMVSCTQSIQHMQETVKSISIPMEIQLLCQLLHPFSTFSTPVMVHILQFIMCKLYLIISLIHFSHFLAKLYGSYIKTTLEAVDPIWIYCHYAQWVVDDNYIVILKLTRVSSFLIFVRVSVADCSTCYRIAL